MVIGLEQLFVCIKVRRPPGSGLAATPQAAFLTAISQGDSCARCPCPDGYGDALALAINVRRNVRHVEGEKSAKAAMVFANDLNDWLCWYDFARLLVNA